MAAQGLVLTPARWATWVAQRHEWNGYLWIRWSDAEAVLLFVGGRPRIHLWNDEGWAEGEHALATVAQRLERLPPPRWGQVALPARWAAAIRDLTLLHPALPVEVAPPQAWLAWAQRQRFTGLAVLVGDVAGAWIVHEGAVRAVRFQQGAVVAEDGTPQPAEGLLQVYRGRVTVDLPPQPEYAPPVETIQPEAVPSPEFAASVHSGAAPAPPTPAESRQVEEVVDQPPAVGASAAGPDAVSPRMPADVERPPTPEATAPPAVTAAAATPTPTAPVSPPAPADSGEITVDQAGSETPRRFRGDERFLLAPTVDLGKPEALEDVLAAHGTGMLRWLPLLDGTRTLEDVARAGAVTLGEVDAVVGALADRRLVFRYTARPRAPAAS